MKNAEAAISSWRAGVKSLRAVGAGGVKNFRAGGVTFAGGSVPHYMPCILTYVQVSGSPMTTCINTAFQCLSVSINSEKGRSAF